MTARTIFIDERKLHVSGLGYQPVGAFSQGSVEVTADNDQVLQVAARIAILCNDAVLEEAAGKWIVRGDPTEGALLVMGRKAGLDPALMVQEFPRVAEVPFSSERKRMTTVHQGPAGTMACLKGAPETILSRCTRLFTGHGEKLLTEGDRQEIIDQAKQMAAGALRVLGLAHRELEMIPESSLEEVEADLVWVGLVGLMDPPRPEAQEAIAKCRQAGIRVIMITGDHPDTALAISREIGLTSPNQHDTAVLSGADLNRMSDDDLLKALNQVLVFARAAPEHKLRIVNLLKVQSEVVAMTGDGVNDAPALKKADIGVAMGITGTEVTKETADMILADDNFATMVAAVEEGRTIYDNIKKYLIFLLSCNLTLILILTVTLFFGMPLPLLAFQILWVNVIIDGPPALALGVDPKAPDIMSRPPRPPEEGIFTRSVIIMIGVITIYLALALTLLYTYYLYTNPGDLSDPDAIEVRARTMMFLTMMLAMLINAFNCRSDSQSLITVGFLANRYLVVSVVLGLVMAVAVVQWPPLARLFHTVPLTWMDWLYATLVSTAVIPLMELVKWALRLTKGET
jgi:Ca2+-transporting ATPase